MRKKFTYYRDWEQMPLALRSDEVAVLLGENVQTIRKFVREGSIPGAKIGKKWYFERDTVKRIIEGSFTRED